MKREEKEKRREERRKKKLMKSQDILVCNIVEGKLKLFTQSTFAEVY